MTERQWADYAASSISHEEPSELRRLRNLQDMWDPFSRACLRRLDPQPWWRCAELGAGAGSLACWLAESAPDGETVATDIDTRFLNEGPANLRVLRHDVRHEDFPPRSFDLVHARGLLAHLPEPGRVVGRAARWLRPGGWLALEGIDLTAGEHSPHLPVRTAVRAVTGLLSDQMGSDATVHRRTPTMLADAGLTAIATDYHPLVLGHDRNATRFFLSNLDQLAPALAAAGRYTAVDRAALDDWLASPAGHDLLGTACWAAARAPAQ
ncbi:methyltransferase domain-containing protein [Streptomyces sp. NPDC002004]